LHQRTLVISRPPDKPEVVDGRLFRTTFDVVLKAG
jgi:hypothetical protein